MHDISAHAQQVLTETADHACDLLSVKEYAGVFGVTVRSVYKAIKRGTIPCEVVRPLGKAPKLLVPKALIAKLRAA